MALQYPNHPTVKFFVQSERLGDKHRKLTVTIENFGDFNLDLSTETDYSSLDSFYILGAVHSDKLSLQKVKFDVRTRTGNSKGLEFKITSNEQNVLSGSADFTTRVDKNQNTIEGKGNVRYYDKANTITFKVIRHVYETARDNEAGISTIINVSVGTQNVVVEFKATDKNFLAKYTACQHSKQCVNVEARSQLERSDVEHFKHLLLVSVDLRELGYTHEFGLKADTHRSGYLQFEHSVDMHLQSQNQPQYQYNFYVQPQRAGAVLTLPARTIALESVYSYPDRSAFGKYQASASFYLDKRNAADKKAEIAVDFDLRRTDGNALSGKGEMRLLHTGMRPLVISGTTKLDPERQMVEGTLVADVFAHANNKIELRALYGNTDTTGKAYNVTVEVSAVSAGLQLNAGFTGHSGVSLERRYMSVGGAVTLPIDDFKFGTFMYAGDEGFNVVAQGFGEELISAHGRFDFKRQDFTFGTLLRFPGIEPLETSGQLTGLTRASFKANQGSVAVFDGLYDLGNELSAKVLSNGQNVMVGRIALDQTHFLATEYKVDEAQVNEFVTRMQTYAQQNAKKAEGFVQQKYEKCAASLKEKLERVRKTTPDFKPVEAMYRAELQRMVEEMKADDTMRAVIDFVENVVQKAAAIADELVTTLSDAYGKVRDILYAFYEQYVTAFVEKVLPDLQALYKLVQQLLLTAYEDTVKLLTATFSRVAKALKGFEEDFNTVSRNVSQIFNEVAKLLNDIVDVVRQEMDEVCRMVKEFVQQIPGMQALREAFNELMSVQGLAESIANVLRDLTTTLTDLLPSAEVKEFVLKFTDYVDQVSAGT